MNNIDLLNTMEIIHQFFEYLKKHYDCSVYENNEHYIINVFSKVDVNFDSTLPLLFSTLKKDYNFPDIIMQSGKPNYYVGVSLFDPDIEYFTIKLYKDQV